MASVVVVTRVMHRQTRRVSPPTRPPTHVSCTLAQSCTLADSGGFTRFTPSLHRHARSGRTSFRRQSGCARLCRSLTRCSKSRRLARTRSPSHRYLRPRQTIRGTRIMHLRERLLAPCPSVSRSSQSYISICWRILIWGRLVHL